MWGSYEVPEFPLFLSVKFCPKSYVVIDVLDKPCHHGMGFVVHGCNNQLLKGNVITQYIWHI